MKPIHTVLSCSVFCFFLCPFRALSARESPSHPAAEESGHRPNVILFFIDDMGVSDLGSFGSQNSRTPHLDRMAEQGIRFTRFYNAWTACTPSRASLLTGASAGRIGMDGRVCFPDEDKALHPDEITLAELFRDAGYATGCFGKWHLGHRKGYLPLDQGFGEYWGIPYSNDMWPVQNRKYPPLPLIHQDQAVAIVRTPHDQSLLTRVFTDKTKDFIRRHADTPFFAYVPYSAVHFPHHAPRSYLDRLKDSPKLQGQRVKPDYVAQVEELDDMVGEVVALLESLELADNTLILFLSDNGGLPASEILPLRGNKFGPPYEGHMRTLFLAKWPGVIPEGSVSDQTAVTTDLFPTFAAWCGGTLPEHEIDGKDIRPLFTHPESAPSPHRFLSYKFEGLREDSWKLILGNPEKTSGTREWELYHLEQDPGEQHNLAAAHPDIVNRLAEEQKTRSAALRAQARPYGRMPNPGPFVEEAAAAGLPSLQAWHQGVDGR